MLSNIKKYWYAGVAIAVAILAFVFKFERDGKIEAEAKLETADSDKKDAVLAQKQSDVQADLSQAQAAHDAEVAKDPTQEELLQALKDIK